MYFSKTTIISLGLLATSELVAGHAAVIGATGDAGGAGSAIGVDPNTPRDGTRRSPFQQDSTRFRGDAADTCGETLGGGDNDIQAGTAQVMQLNGPTLPQVTQGGALMMTVHQVNGDGAGPYTCMIDSTGTGTNWTQMQVTTNLDGNARGRNNDNQMMDLPLNVAIAADQTCTGTVAGQSNVCMVRCQNPARAGPFGGCVPIQMAGAAGAAGAAAPAAAGAVAPAAGTAAGAVPAANAPATGAAGTVPAANAPVAGAAAGTAGTAPAAGAVPAANAPVAGASAGTVPAAGAVPAANAPAAGTAAGAVPATGATTATTKREAKKDSPNGPALTDDDQEEEVDLLDGEEAKRWVVTDN